MLVNQSLSVSNSHCFWRLKRNSQDLIFWFCSELFRPWPLWPRPAVIKSSAPCRTNTEAEEGIDLRKPALTPQLHMFVFLLLIVRSHQLNLDSLQWKCDALSSFLTANWVRVMESKRFPPPLFPSITLHLKISCPPSPDHSQKGLVPPEPQRPPHQPVPQVSIRVESDSEESAVYSRECRYNPFAPTDPPAPPLPDRVCPRPVHLRDSCAETILWTESLE